MTVGCAIYGVRMDKDSRDELDASAFPLTANQRIELRQRLADYKDSPDEPVVTLADIRRELGLS